MNYISIGIWFPNQVFLEVNWKFHELSNFYNFILFGRRVLHEIWIYKNIFLEAWRSISGTPTSWPRLVDIKVFLIPQHTYACFICKSKFYHWCCFLIMTNSTIKFSKMRNLIRTGANLTFKLSGKKIFLWPKGKFFFYCHIVKYRKGTFGRFTFVEGNENQNLLSYCYIKKEK